MWVSPDSQSPHKSLGFLVQMKAPLLKATTRQKAQIIHLFERKKKKSSVATRMLVWFSACIISLEDISLKLNILSAPTVLATKKD